MHSAPYACSQYVHANNLNAACSPFHLADSQHAFESAHAPSVTSLSVHGSDVMQIAQAYLPPLTHGSTAPRVHLMVKCAAAPAVAALQKTSALYVKLGSTPSSAAAVCLHILAAIGTTGADGFHGALVVLNMATSRQAASSRP
jgi:hypothetical protein